MNLPFAGSIQGRVLRVASASIHGDIYFDLVIEPEGVPPAPEGKVNALSVRVPLHAVPGGAERGAPEVGRRVAISFLMQQATGVTYLE